MPYIDKTYYDDTYQGTPIDDVDEFNRTEKRASEIIDQLTGYKIQDITLLTNFQQEQVKKAVASQIEHYALNGGYDAFKQSSNMGNVSIGSFSYQSNNPGKLSPNLTALLSPTGLLYRGVATRG